MKLFITLLTISCAVTAPLSARAVNDSKTLKSEYAAKMSASAHNEAAIEAMEQQDWRVALRNFIIISVNFEHDEVAQDAQYFQGVCHYHLNDLDMANKKLSDYLNSHPKLRYFEDALTYKFAIAKKFLQGSKKHLFNSEKMPLWADATETGEDLLEQIIDAVPNHDLAAKCYYEKGKMLLASQEFKEAIDMFQTLIRKFPKHPLAADGYQAIGEVYYIQSHSEYHNTDLLELAQINLNKFEADFPRGEKLEKTKEFLADMHEIHAKGLYETGLFYERTKKPRASVVYYTTALEKFPESPSAKRCKSRLIKLDDQVKELQVSEDIIN